MTVSDPQGGFGVPPGDDTNPDGRNPEPVADTAEQLLQLTKEYSGWYKSGWAPASTEEAGALE